MYWIGLLRLFDRRMPNLQQSSFSFIMSKARTCTADHCEKIWHILHLVSAGLLVIGLLFSYPMAAVPLKVYNYEYHFVLAFGLPLSVLGFFIWLESMKRLPISLNLGVIIFTLAGFVAILTTEGTWQAFFELGMVVFIPAAIAGIVATNGLLGIRFFASILVITTVVNLIAAVSSIKHGMQPLGLAGNINWTAASLATGLPFLGWLLFAWTEKKGGVFSSFRLPVAIVTGLILTGLAAWVLIKCESRATILAGMVIVLLGVFLILPWWGRFIQIVICCMLGLWFLIQFHHPIIKSLEDDVRIPMIGRTVAMTADHDVVTAALQAIATASMEPFEELQAPTGIGPGEFRKVFAPYRANSRYGVRGVAAAVTIHPHNEFLFVMAQVGLIGAFGWLLVLSATLRGAGGGELDALGWAARFSAWAAVAHAMFDMNLVQPPCHLMGFAAIGLCWATLPGAESEEEKSVQPTTQLPFQVRVTCAVLAICMVGWATILLVEKANSAYYDRLARIAMHVGNDGRAIELFEKVLAVDSEDINARYALGRLYAKQEKTIDKSSQYLESVIAQDPSFAHTNLLLGLNYMKQDKFADGLVCFQKEVALYPYALDVRQRVASGLFLSGKVADANREQKKIDTLTYDVAGKSREDASDLETEMTDWWSAVGANNQELAIEKAKSAVGRSLITQLDPMLSVLLQQAGIPNRLLESTYGQSDFELWRCWYLRLALLHEWQGDSSEAMTPLRMAQHFLDTFEMVEPKRPQPPRMLTELHQTRKGTPLELTLVFSDFCRYHGWAMVAKGRPPKDPAKGYIQCLLISQNDAAYLVDFQAGTVDKVSIQEWFSQNPDWVTGTYFQSLFFKNHQLAVLALHIQGIPAVDALVMPGMETWLLDAGANGKGRVITQAASRWIPDQIIWLSTYVQLAQKGAARQAQLERQMQGTDSMAVKEGADATSH